MTQLLKEFRSLDGSGNNLNNPSENQTGTGERELLPRGPGVGTGTNARQISNVVSSGPHADDANPQGLSAMMYVWGQFLDHDMDLTPQDNTNHIDITIPAGDPTKPEGSVISLTRFMLQDGTAKNTVSGWIDGSQVYGSDTNTANSLRLPDGHLATSSGNNSPIVNGHFVAGDVRVAENPDLTSITTLFVREHNRLVDQLHRDNPSWTGDQLYNMGRAIVGAEIENITYTEFLPHLLGMTAIPVYTGYDPSVDARITEEFSTTTFRFGHSIISGVEEKVGPDGKEISSQKLSDAFNDTPADVESDGGVESLLRGITRDLSVTNDVFVINDLRNLLADSPVFTDLFAVDIQRERDLNISNLNQARIALGLKPYGSFSDLTTDPNVLNNLIKSYNSINDVDLFIGGLAEPHIQGAIVGETFRTMLTNQFIALRDGDRLWWQNAGFDSDTQKMIASRTLANILDDNANVTIPGKDVFLASNPVDAS